MKVSKGTLTRLRNELTKFFGKMVDFDASSIAIYDTSPEMSAFVYMKPKNFRCNLSSEFLERLMENRFYAGYRVSRFLFGHEDSTTRLVLGLDLKRS